jgi:N4-gp56 family major capsid protein
LRLNIGDQFYICVAHPHQLRSIRDDNDWKHSHEYVNPTNIYNGEVGRYENVLFIETTQQRIQVGAGNGGADVYQAMFMGARSVGFAETVPMELVTDGIEDFGRFISLGWYTIMGAGIINDYLVENYTL